MFSQPNGTGKLPLFMKTSYQLKHLTTLTQGLLLTTLSAAIVSSWLAAPGKTFPSDTAVATVSLPVAQRPSLMASAFKELNDYQPPDNGGPSRTGGSGTRWRGSDGKRLMLINV